VSGGSFIYLVRGGLGLPDWSSTALFTLSLATAVGLALGLWISRRWGPYRTLMIAFCADLLAAGLLLALPARDPNALLAWAALRGLFSGVDFMLLRALAGEELDADTAASGVSQAGVIYSTFHLPYNLAAALATALLFAAYQWANADLKSLGEIPERGLVWIPAALGVLLSVLSLVAIWTQATQERRQTAHSS
jgi:Na+/melibiose symporter-like transporter